MSIGKLTSGTDDTPSQDKTATKFGQSLQANATNNFVAFDKPTDPQEIKKGDKISFGDGKVEFTVENVSDQSVTLTGPNGTIIVNSKAILEVNEDGDIIFMNGSDGKNRGRIIKQDGKFVYINSSEAGRAVAKVITSAELAAATKAVSAVEENKPQIDIAVTLRSLESKEGWLKTIGTPQATVFEVQSGDTIQLGKDMKLEVFIEKDEEEKTGYRVDVIYEDKKAKKAYRLRSADGIVFIGREISRSFPNTVSKRHGFLKVLPDGRALYIDLGSKNGSSVTDEAGNQRQAFPKAEPYVWKDVAKDKVTEEGEKNLEGFYSDAPLGTVADDNGDDNNKLPTLKIGDSLILRKRDGELKLDVLKITVGNHNKGEKSSITLCDADTGDWYIIITDIKNAVTFGGSEKTAIKIKNPEFKKEQGVFTYTADGFTYRHTGKRSKFEIDTTQRDEAEQAKVDAALLEEKNRMTAQLRRFYDDKRIKVEDPKQSIPMTDKITVIAGKDQDTFFMTAERNEDNANQATVHFTRVGSTVESSSPQIFPGKYDIYSDGRLEKAKSDKPDDVVGILDFNTNGIYYNITDGNPVDVAFEFFTRNTQPTSTVKIRIKPQRYLIYGGRVHVPDNALLYLDAEQEGYLEQRALKITGVKESDNGPVIDASFQQSSRAASKTLSLKRIYVYDGGYAAFETQEAGALRGVFYIENDKVFFEPNRLRTFSTVAMDLARVEGGKEAVEEGLPYLVEKKDHKNRPGYNLELSGSFNGDDGAELSEDKPKQVVSKIEANKTNLKQLPEKIGEFAFQKQGQSYLLFKGRKASDRTYVFTKEQLDGVIKELNSLGIKCTLAPAKGGNKSVFSLVVNESDLVEDVAPLRLKQGDGTEISLGDTLKISDVTIQLVDQERFLFKIVAEPKNNPTKIKANERTALTKDDVYGSVGSGATEISIGSGVDNDIIISSGALSDLHGKLIKKDGKIFYEHKGVNFAYVERAASPAVPQIAEKKIENTKPAQKFSLAESPLDFSIVVAMNGEYTPKLSQADAAVIRGIIESVDKNIDSETVVNDVHYFTIRKTALQNGKRETLERALKNYSDAINNDASSTTELKFKTDRSMTVLMKPNESYALEAGSTVYFTDKTLLWVSQESKEKYTVTIKTLNGTTKRFSVPKSKEWRLDPQSKEPLPELEYLNSFLEWRGVEINPEHGNRFYINARQNVDYGAKIVTEKSVAELAPGDQVALENGDAVVIDGKAYQLVDADKFLLYIEDSNRFRLVDQSIYPVGYSPEGEGHASFAAFIKKDGKVLFKRYDDDTSSIAIRVEKKININSVQLSAVQPNGRVSPVAETVFDLRNKKVIFSDGSWLYAYQKDESTYLMTLVDAERHITRLEIPIEPTEDDIEKLKKIIGNEELFLKWSGREFLISNLPTSYDSVFIVGCEEAMPAEFSDYVYDTKLDSTWQRLGTGHVLHFDGGLFSVLRWDKETYLARLTKGGKTTSYKLSVDPKISINRFRGQDDDQLLLKELKILNIKAEWDRATFRVGAIDNNLSTPKTYIRHRSSRGQLQPGQKISLSRGESISINNTLLEWVDTRYEVPLLNNLSTGELSKSFNSINKEISGKFGVGPSSNSIYFEANTENTFIEKWVANENVELSADNAAQIAAKTPKQLEPGTKFENSETRQLLKPSAELSSNSTLHFPDGATLNVRRIENSKPGDGMKDERYLVTVRSKIDSKNGDIPALEVMLEDDKDYGFIKVARGKDGFFTTQYKLQAQQYMIDPPDEWFEHFLKERGLELERDRGKFRLKVVQENEYNKDSYIITKKSTTVLQQPKQQVALVDGDSVTINGIQFQLIDKERFKVDAVSGQANGGVLIEESSSEYLMRNANTRKAYGRFYKKKGEVFYEHKSDVPVTVEKAFQAETNLQVPQLEASNNQRIETVAEEESYDERDLRPEISLPQHAEISFILQWETVDGKQRPYYVPDVVKLKQSGKWNNLNVPSNGAFLKEHQRYLSYLKEAGIDIAGLDSAHVASMRIEPSAFKKLASLSAQSRLVPPTTVAANEDNGVTEASFDNPAQISTSFATINTETRSIIFYKTSDNKITATMIVPQGEKEPSVTANRLITIYADGTMDADQLPPELPRGGVRVLGSIIRNDAGEVFYHPGQDTTARVYQDKQTSITTSQPTNRSKSGKPRYEGPLPEIVELNSNARLMRKVVGTRSQDNNIIWSHDLHTRDPSMLGVWNENPGWERTQQAFNHEYASLRAQGLVDAEGTYLVGEVKVSEDFVRETLQKQINDGTLTEVTKQSIEAELDQKFYWGEIPSRVPTESGDYQFVKLEDGTGRYRVERQIGESSQYNAVFEGDELQNVQNILKESHGLRADKWQGNNFLMLELSDFEMRKYLGRNPQLLTKKDESVSTDKQQIYVVTGETSIPDRTKILLLDTDGNKYSWYRVLEIGGVAFSLDEAGNEEPVILAQFKDMKTGLVRAIEASKIYIYDDGVYTSAKPEAGIFDNNLEADKSFRGILVIEDGQIIFKPNRTRAQSGIAVDISSVTDTDKKIINSPYLVAMKEMPDEFTGNTGATEPFVSGDTKPAAPTKSQPTQYNTIKPRPDKLDEYRLSFNGQKLKFKSSGKGHALLFDDEPAAPVTVADKRTKRILNKRANVTAKDLVGFLYQQGIDIEQDGDKFFAKWENLKKYIEKNDPEFFAKGGVLYPHFTIKPGQFFQADDKTPWSYELVLRDGKYLLQEYAGGEINYSAVPLQIGNQARLTGNKLIVNESGRVILNNITPNSDITKLYKVYEPKIAEEGLLLERIDIAKPVVNEDLGDERPENLKPFTVGGFEFGYAESAEPFFYDLYFKGRRLTKEQEFNGRNAYQFLRFDYPFDISLVSKGYIVSKASLNAYLQRQKENEEKSKNEASTNPIYANALNIVKNNDEGNKKNLGALKNNGKTLTYLFDPNSLSRFSPLINAQFIANMLAANNQIKIADTPKSSGDATAPNSESANQNDATLQVTEGNERKTTLDETIEVTDEKMRNRQLLNDIIDAEANLKLAQELKSARSNQDLLDNILGDGPGFEVQKNTPRSDIDGRQVLDDILSSRSNGSLETISTRTETPNTAVKTQVPSSAETLIPNQNMDEAVDDLFSRRIDERINPKQEIVSSDMQSLREYNDLGPSNDLRARSSNPADDILIARDADDVWKFRSNPVFDDIASMRIPKPSGSFYDSFPTVEKYARMGAPSKLASAGLAVNGAFSYIAAIDTLRFAKQLYVDGNVPGVDYTKAMFTGTKGAYNNMTRQFRAQLVTDADGNVALGAASAVPGLQEFALPGAISTSYFSPDFPAATDKLNTRIALGYFEEDIKNAIYDVYASGDALAERYYGEKATLLRERAYEALNSGFRFRNGYVLKLSPWQLAYFLKIGGARALMIDDGASARLTKNSMVDAPLAEKLTKKMLLPGYDDELKERKRLRDLANDQNPSATFKKGISELWDNTSVNNIANAAIDYADRYNQFYKKNIETLWNFAPPVLLYNYGSATLKAIYNNIPSWDELADRGMLATQASRSFYSGLFNYLKTGMYISDGNELSGLVRQINYRSGFTSAEQTTEATPVSDESQEEKSEASLETSRYVSQLKNLKNEYFFANGFHLKLTKAESIGWLYPRDESGKFFYDKNGNVVAAPSIDASVYVDDAGQAYVLTQGLPDYDYGGYTQFQISDSRVKSSDIKVLNLTTGNYHPSFDKMQSERLSFLNGVKPVMGEKGVEPVLQRDKERPVLISPAKDPNFVPPIGTQTVKQTAVAQRTKVKGVVRKRVVTNISGGLTLSQLIDPDLKALIDIVRTASQTKFSIVEAFMPKQKTEDKANSKTPSKITAIGFRPKGMEKKECGVMTREEYDAKFKAEEKKAFKAVADMMVEQARAMGYIMLWGGDMNGNGQQDEENFNPAYLVLLPKPNISIKQDVQVFSQPSTQP